MSLISSMPQSVILVVLKLQGLRDFIELPVQRAPSSLIALLFRTRVV